MQKGEDRAPNITVNLRKFVEMQMANEDFEMLL